MTPTPAAKPANLLDLAAMAPASVQKSPGFRACPFCPYWVFITTSSEDQSINAELDIAGHLRRKHGVQTIRGKP